MDPVKRRDHNFTYRGPSTGIGDLSCWIDPDDKACWSHWKPSAAELEKLNNGAQVALGIWTEPIPPVAVGVVDKRHDDVKAEPAVPAAILESAVRILTAELTERGLSPAPAEEVLKGLENCINYAFHPIKLPPGGGPARAAGCICPSEGQGKLNSATGKLHYDVEKMCPIHGLAEAKASGVLEEER